MSRNGFFAAIAAFFMAPFTWAATALKADQLQTGATGNLRVVAVGDNQKFTYLSIGSGLKSDGVNLSTVAGSAPALSVSALVRNSDATYQYTGGAVYRNGLLQTPVVDYSVSGTTLTPIPVASWASDDAVSALKIS